jgi:hypothetical protein
MYILSSYMFLNMMIILIEITVENRLKWIVIILSAVVCHLPLEGFSFFYHIMDDLHNSLSSRQVPKHYFQHVRSFKARQEAIRTNGGQG